MNLQRRRKKRVPAKRFPGVKPGERFILDHYEPVEPGSKIKTPVFRTVPYNPYKENPAAADERPRIESPGLVLPSVVIEQIEVSGLGDKYAIHELMPDGTWRTREDNNFPDPDGRGILVPKARVRWPLPRRPTEYRSDEQLFDEVRQFFCDNLDLQDEREYDLLAAFVLMTWRFEQFSSVPYLFFLGPKESGKSRALQCLEAVCYRGWFTTHPSLASLHHVMNAWHPTFLLDNFESLPRERRYEMEGIFNAGYRRGGAVDRIEPLPEGGFKEKWYEVYGPKALAGTREPSEALESRCIKFRMSKTQKSYSKNVNSERAQEIRSKLLAYRFRHLSSPREPQHDVPNAYGRLGEIFAPLVAVAPNQEVLNRLMDYGNGIRLERDEEDKTTFDAQVVRALVSCRPHEEDHRVAIKDIVNAFNEDLPEKDRAKSRSIGWALSRLGLRKVRMPDKAGSKGIQWDRPIIERLAVRYGVELEPDEAAPNTPALSVRTSDSQKRVQEIEPESDHLTNLTKSAGIVGVSGEPLEASDLSEMERALAKLRAINGPFSRDYALEQVCKVTKDRSKAEAYLKHFQDNGLILRDPEGYWRLSR
jgi:hypothetical protein